MKVTMAEVIGFIVFALVLGVVIPLLKTTDVITFFRHYFDAGIPHY